MSFFEAPSMQNNGFLCFTSGLLTKSSHISKVKHLLWGGNTSWRYGTMPKSLFFHFLYHQKSSFCAVWGVMVYDNGWFLRPVRSYIMNNMELGVFINIIDIFNIKIRFLKNFFRREGRFFPYEAQKQPTMRSSNIIGTQSLSHKLR